MIKNYTNLIYADQLTKRSKKHKTIQKAQKTQFFGCTFSPKLHLGNAVLRKKEPPIFIYKGMTLTL